MADSSRLSNEDQLFRAQLLREEPRLDATIAWAQRLGAVLQRNATGDLDEIVAAGDGTMLERFAAGLRRDFAAISAALELPWTTSPVEGQISRLKMLKSTMYGCAFRRKPAADSDRSQPALPMQTSHRFRLKPAALEG
jgi:transposase